MAITALITDYATLQAAVADFLNRTSLTEQVKVFIQLAEDEFRIDPRLRKLQDAVTFSITQDNVTMPTDMVTPESWYHDSDTRRGEIEIVSAGDLARLKSTYGTTGVPQFAALIGGKAKFAPAPDGTYSTKLTYWRYPLMLSDTQTTNWLIDDHPAIYLYGALMQAAPFLKDDERVPVWEKMLEKNTEKLHAHTQERQFGGLLNRQPDTVIGG